MPGSAAENPYLPPFSLEVRTALTPHHRARGVCVAGCLNGEAQFTHGSISSRFLCVCGYVLLLLGAQRNWALQPIMASGMDKGSCVVSEPKGEQLEREKKRVNPPHRRCCCNMYGSVKSLEAR